MRVLGVAIEAGCVRALAVRGGQVLWAAEAEYRDLEELAQVLARLAGERPARYRKARVALGDEVAQLKVVHAMPRLRRRDLASHVALEPRRYFLQNGGPLVTDAVVITSGNGPAGRAALLAAAPEPLVEAAAQGLAGAGCSVTAIAPAAHFLEAAGRAAHPALANLGEAAARFEAAWAAASMSPRLCLFPNRLRRQNERHRKMGAWRWAAAGALWLVLAAVTYVAALARQGAVAEAELERLGPTVRGALAVRADLRRAEEALSLLGRAEGERPQLSRLLARITAALPDSAFLAMLRLDRDGQGVLVGYAPRAAQVAALLERTQGVLEPSLDGPVVREVVGGRELDRFSLRFRTATATGRLR
jgi:hypothetical protein